MTDMVVKRGRGRPTKLTRARRNEAVPLFASAQSQADIAAILGVSLSTLRLWLTEGKRFFEDKQERGIAYPTGKKAWADFSVDCARARANYIKLHTDNIASHGTDDWRASAWIAKVMDRERYGDAVATTLSGPSGGPVQVQGSLAAAISAAIEATPELILDAGEDDD